MKIIRCPMIFIIDMLFMAEIISVWLKNCFYINSVLTDRYGVLENLVTFTV